MSSFMQNNNFNQPQFQQFQQFQQMQQTQQFEQFRPHEEQFQTLKPFTVQQPAHKYQVWQIYNNQ